MKKRTMRQPIVITTPYPTPEQVAKNYGVSQKRLKDQEGENETCFFQSSYRPKEKNECRLKLARSFEASVRHNFSAR
jgi:hypothetical protein